jgi:hypothetical protein
MATAILSLEQYEERLSGPSYVCRRCLETPVSGAEALCQPCAVRDAAQNAAEDAAAEASAALEVFAEQVTRSVELWLLEGVSASDVPAARERLLAAQKLAWKLAEDVLDRFGK